MEANIKTLMQMKIGDIKGLEILQKKTYIEMGNIIDRQRETVASFIEQEKVDEEWADNFLKEMEIDGN